MNGERADETPQLNVVRVPVLDTGIGIEAGYESDVKPVARRHLEAMERDVDERIARHFLYGDPA